MGLPRVYRPRRYEFGQKLLDLRTRILLTQNQLAEQIGVHWRTVQNWETGESYPKAETLQRLIVVCFHLNAFTPGREWEEAKALWQQVAEDGPHALAFFDEAWFAQTLAQDVPASTLPTTTPLLLRRMQRKARRNHSAHPLAQPSRKRAAPLSIGAKSSPSPTWLAASRSSQRFISGSSQTIVDWWRFWGSAALASRALRLSLPIAS